jgi:DNA-binding MarR family transcriptional regulator
VGSQHYSNVTHTDLSEPTADAPRGLLGETLAAFARATAEPSQAVHQSRFVRAMQTARRQRDAFFNGALFADPAWDILLEVYARHLEGQRITVSNLCSAAHVPSTTALRWIARMEDEGLLVREQDPSDARRSWLELSSAAVEQMRRYVQTMSLASTSV